MADDPKLKPCPTELKRITQAVADKHGCDLSTFSVCWNVRWDGVPCQCEIDAIADWNRRHGRKE